MKSMNAVPPDANDGAPPGPMGLVKAPDEALVRQVLDGDTEAFAELVRRYQDRVFNFSLRFTGNASDAEEIVQEAFLKAYRNLSRFRGDAKFSTWLFQIAKNLCINRFHRARRRMAHRQIRVDEEPAEGEAAPLQLESEDPSPQEEALRHELRDKLEAAITELDPHYRAALVLRDVEGLDYADIAEVLSVPVGTVKSRIHRARLELQQMLTPFLEEG